MKLPTLLLFLLSYSVSASVPALSAPSEEIQLQIDLDRTAFFVGEPVFYKVRVRYAPSIEFVLERFDEQNFQMDPFHLKELRVTHSEGDDFRILTIIMELVSYEIEQDEWRVPSFNLYYTRGNVPVDIAGQSGVEVLTVPPTLIAFRSVLPEGTFRIRDGIALEPLTGPFGLALTLGLLGVISTAIPLGRWGYRRIRREETVGVLDHSQIRENAAAAIRQLEKANVDDPSSIFRFYESLAEILRAYVGELSGDGGRALTVPELKGTLIEAGVDPNETDRLCDLVALADRVRYSAAGIEWGGERLQDISAQALTLLKR